MKKAFVNGKFYVEKGCFAQAVLIEDDKFVLVGTNDEIRAAAGDAEIFDCGGKTVIPGINDSHCHMIYYAITQSYVQIMGSRSIDEVIERGRQFLKDHPKAKGLRGMGWNVVDFVEGEQRNLTRHDLDKISTEIPINFQRACGHMNVFNTKALELAGVDENTAQVEGGVFEVEENGYPNGRFLETAKDLVAHVVPEPTLEEITENVYKVMEYCASLGITSVQSNDPGQFMTYGEIYGLLHKIHDANEMKIRYRSQSLFRSVEDFEKYVKTEGKDPRYDDVLSFGPLKLLKDGSIGGHSALMREPYLDVPDSVGVSVLTDEQLDAFCEAADKHNVQVVTHCIGDGAVQNLIDHYAKVLRDGKNPLRHGIVHCQIMDRGMMEQLAKYQILALEQPIFLSSDMHALKTRIPESLARTSNAYRSMMELGIPQSFGTDAPVEDLNPFPNIYSAVTRKDMHGYPEGGYYPEERLTVEETLDFYTVGSAYAEFMEDRLGRIKPGYYADMAMLSKDIFTCDVEEIKGITSELTLMGGKVTFQA